MNGLVPTAAQIRAQVATVHQKVPEARVIGIQAPRPLDLPDELEVDGAAFEVASCRSVLDLRDRLSASGDGPRLVLLTEVPEAELGADVLARLARRHLHSIDPWLLVRYRFQARYVDPRLVRQAPWVATELLNAEPPGGFAPAPSGFLQAETAWRVLFEALLGLPGGERDPQALLAWSMDPYAAPRLQALDETVREGLRVAVEDVAGAVGAHVFACLAGPLGPQAVAVGLVARALYDLALASSSVATRAQGRLEGELGGHAPSPEAALAWADAAEALIRDRLRTVGAATEVRSVLTQADGLLARLGAAECARVSPLLPTGLDQRLIAFAEALAKLVEGRAKAVPQALERALDYALEHSLTAHDAHRGERAEMAIRLARWLARRRSAGSQPCTAGGKARGTAGGSALAEAAERYRLEGAFVDRARTYLRDGDPLPTVAAAYNALLNTADGLREQDNQDFAKRFAGWCKSGSADERLIPVERVLERVVAPLAARAPVLLIVMDGMSQPVYRDIQADLAARGWVELVPGGGAGNETGSEPANGPALGTVIAAVPTVTEVSRASLLCGRLTTGNASVETAAFKENTSLPKAKKSGKPPVLFHKGALTQPGSPGLSSEVRAALEDEAQQIVGVVVNAVDDYLSKGEQLRVEWAINAVRPLGDLLSRARDAGRAVILVSDHGHVIEYGSERHYGEDAERWREATTPPGEHEVLIEGPRVLLGKGHQAILPWSERIRYANRKNGYHGGATPQEVLIPLGVFVDSGVSLDGWAEAPPDWPAWWDGPEEEFSPRKAGAGPKRKAPAPKLPDEKGGQGHLFPAETPPEAEIPDPAAEDVPIAWIETLLASEVLAAQRGRQRRGALDDAQIRAILTALDGRGGKITSAALARHLKVPALRVRGIVSVLRRLLNVDGYDVLSVDEPSDTVVLNRDQLDMQFGL